MSAEGKCRECGTTIPAESRGGFCPQCLLNLGLQEAASPSGAQISAPAFGISPTTEKPGDRIGRYRLLQEIGHGGCGVVYMAEQEHPVRRKVALKVIKLGMDTKQVVVRFEAERQALALMDHPNIAKIYDAGVTEAPLPASGHPLPSSDEGRGQGEGSSVLTRHPSLVTSAGRPYFVMELVGGIKITDYCDQHQLTTRQRLDLFIEVCLAIQHAHQKGVIHRDVKPSNVLVAEQDGRPVPKVIDFGIAKATQGRLTDQTLFTAFEQFLGTPAYMSPEQTQLGSLDVDTRSDIYSLGVLLYELLTGTTPFETKELVAAGLDEMRRTIREVEPVKPSTRLTQTSKSEIRSPKSEKSAIGNRQSAIPTDLDWIVMKCLEKDRARRYETANGLASDLQRHLNNEPVVARPPSTLYEFQKTVRRHKFGFAASGGIAVALVIGLTIALWQSVEKSRANRALRDEAAKSRQVATFLQGLLKSVGPSVAAGRDTEMLREILDQAAARIASELTNQPAVEAELRTTMGFAYWELGEHEKAEIMYRRSLELSRRIGRDDLALADTLHKLADLLRSHGNRTRADYMYIEAEELEREALAIYTKVHGRQHLSVGDSLHCLADILWSRGKLNEAEDAARESLAINQRLCDPDHPNVGVCLGQQGIVLMLQGKLAEAEIVLENALAILRKALARPQGSWSGLNPHVELGAALGVKGRLLLRQNRLDEAEATFRESLAVRTKVLGNDHLYVVGAIVALADTLAAQGRLNEAESLLCERIEQLERSFGADHRVNFVLKGLAQLLQKSGKLAEAEAAWREQVALEKNLSGEQHPLVANSLEELGSMLLGESKSADAENLFNECLVIREKSLPNAWQTFNTRTLLGASLMAQKKYTEAEPLLLSGYQGMKERESSISANGKDLLKEALARIVQLYEATDRPDHAAEWKQKQAEFERAPN